MSIQKPSDPPDPEDAVFRAMASPLRRRLLDALKAGPQTTGALCAVLPALDRCTVMQHLGVLETAGLVVVERRGRERWNHLDVRPIVAIQHRWIGPYAALAAESLDKFAAQLEGA